MTTATRPEPTSRQIRLILALRGALTGDRCETVTYHQAAQLLHECAALAATVEEVEEAIKADVRHRWELHLPQVFRPVWGASRKDPTTPPWFILVQNRLGELGDHGTLALVPDQTKERLARLVEGLDFVEFQRLAALLFDGLGYFVRSYGMGYRHGTDVWVAKLEGEAIEEIIVEAKCRTLNATEAARQVRGYVAEWKAHRGIIVHNREASAPPPEGVEVWNLSRIVDEMAGARAGIDAAGQVDVGFFRDLYVNFSAS